MFMCYEITLIFGTPLLTRKLGECEQTRAVESEPNNFGWLDSEPKIFLMVEPEPEIWVPVQTSCANNTMLFLFFGPNCS